MVRWRYGWLLAGLCLWGPAAAQTMEGEWVGHLTVGKSRPPANASFNWEKGYWSFNWPAGASWSSYHIKLELTGDYRNIGGTYTATLKTGDKSTAKYEIDGNFAFDKKLLVWQPNKLVQGKTQAASTVTRTLTYTQVDDWEYLKGRWVAQDGYIGVMELRRQYGGEPLRDDQVVPDLVEPTVDEPHEISCDGLFLALNENQDGVVCKADAAADARKWQFEAAGDGWPKAYRLVPSGLTEKCLVPTNDDNGGLQVVGKADDPEGGQFWRLEGAGERILLVNVRASGRALYIEDRDSGQTIIRSRNEAHQTPWLVSKL
ncbi:MAG: hypothetical protein IT204_19940 [Fimbriimonadaceae bacterium]|nr:hypothetical protein [Fimbriimonadaceae bacterium]